MSFVTRQANHCDVCGHEWLTTSGVDYTHCTSGKCRSRKWNASAVKSPAVADPVVVVEPVVAPVSNLAALPVADRKAAVLASLGHLGVATVAQAEANPDVLQASVSSAALAPVEREPCRYTEPDMETGDVFGCALHLGHKQKHVRGAKVGDIW